MPAMVQRLHDALNDPTALEALYREDPGAFEAAFPEVSHTAPDSPILQTWRARLEYRDPPGPGRTRLWHAIGIGVLAGALVRLPALQLTEAWYYPRIAPTLALLAVAAYFWLADRHRGRLMAGLALAVVVVGYGALLPGATEADYTDSVVMAIVHLPVLSWAFLGLVFTRGAWRDAAARIGFVRYNGELLILASLVALGGFVFSGLTVALFELLFEQPEEWYFRNIGIIGAMGVPLAASYLYEVVFRRRTGIAPVLARIFAPLFLVMTVTYLVVAFVGGQNPFVDREFLITFNGLLVVVLGMTVFSIAERGEEDRVGWVDHVNVALLLVTLVVDLIALSAILFRITSYGFTPNRVVVLGANLVIMVHLAWTCIGYLALLRGRAGTAVVRRTVTGYLPVYVAWAAVVVFILPAVFRFG